MDEFFVCSELLFSQKYLHIWLVVSNILYLSIIYGIIIFPLSFIFFRGVGQPPTRYGWNGTQSHMTHMTSNGDTFQTSRHFEHFKVYHFRSRISYGHFTAHQTDIYGTFTVIFGAKDEVHLFFGVRIGKCHKNGLLGQSSLKQ